MKQGVPWPISLCKLEAGNSSTQIETVAHLRAAVIAKNTKIELVCNNRWGLIIFWRTIYLILRDLFKIQMDKSLLVKWNIQTKNVYTIQELCSHPSWTDSIKTSEAISIYWNGSVSKWQTVQLTVLWFSNLTQTVQRSVKWLKSSANG